jgi:hypothetical protein
MGIGVIFRGATLGIRVELPVWATDEHRASELGRLFLGKYISQREYDAGIDYGETIIDYLQTIDAPDPYGGDMASFTDEGCWDRKLKMAKARAAVAKAGHKAAVIVDRVTVYGEGLAPDELPLLRAGLRALSGN